MGTKSFNTMTPNYHRRTLLKKGKDLIKKDDLLITLLEKDNILSKYKIPKTEIQKEIHGLKEDHLSMNNVIDLLKKWNISKIDEDILIKDLSEYTRRKHLKSKSK